MADAGVLESRGQDKECNVQSRDTMPLFLLFAVGASAVGLAIDWAAVEYRIPTTGGGIQVRVSRGRRLRPPYRSRVPDPNRFRHSRDN